VCRVVWTVAQRTILSAFNQATVKVQSTVSRLPLLQRLCIQPKFIGNMSPRGVAEKNVFEGLLDFKNTLVFQARPPSD
jgi:hypothetical protein